MSVAVAATCACLFMAGVAFARSGTGDHVARGSGLQFMDFRYLGVSSAEHGLSMELRTQTGTANATVRLHTDGSKRILASYHVGVVSHTWHRFVLREHGTVPRPGSYDLDVYEGATYGATFYFTVT